MFLPMYCRPDISRSATGAREFDLLLSTRNTRRPFLPCRISRHGSASEPEDTVEVARIANDEMAKLVSDHPARFVGAVTCMPMNDMDAALREAERCIDELGFHGVEIFTDINGKPLDAAEFFPLYEMMETNGLPIILHPRRTNTTPDYPGEEKSKYLTYTNFGWPYVTSLAMARLAFGVFVKHPKLKVLTHHGGGMIPFFHKRAEFSWELHETCMDYDFDGAPLEKNPIDYYRMFYCDTVLQGNVPALMCAFDFFGADQMLFATDAPYDSQTPIERRFSRETLEGFFACESCPSARSHCFARTCARRAGAALDIDRRRSAPRDHRRDFRRARPEALRAALGIFGLSPFPRGRANR